MTGQPSGWGGRFYSGGTGPLPTPTGAGADLNQHFNKYLGYLLYTPERRPDYVFKVTGSKVKVMYKCVSLLTCRGMRMTLELLVAMLGHGRVEERRG